MRANRYLTVLLTIIAIELGWIALNQTAVPVTAQASAPVVITGIDLPAGMTLPVEVRGSVIVEANRPLRVEADPPLKVQIPVTSSPRPGID
jgi:hypothetical protein